MEALLEALRSFSCPDYPDCLESVMFGPEQLTPLGPYERAQSSHEIASQRCVLTESVHGGPFLTKCLYIFHKVCMSRIIIAECATTLIHVRLNANLDVCASDLYATSRHTSDIF